jgi:hypothetical protein
MKSARSAAFVPTPSHAYASGQALAYVYARETSNEANVAGVLTFDEAPRIGALPCMPPTFAR